MGEVGKELLRERIKNKRASEGLTDITQEELFAKKPRYELSNEEQEKLVERRQRNKEAAEKSRKKKKEEFEKLQMENEQLNQDKCELAAMIEKLKGDLNTMGKENQRLLLQIEQLKRWIGKRADSLGLGKHVKQGTARDKHSDRSDKSVLRGDPSLQAAVVADSHTPDQELPVPEGHVTRPESPASSTKSASPPPPSVGDFQPVGLRTTVRRSLQTPWLVETPDPRGQHQDKDDVIITGMTPPQSPSSHTTVPVMSQGQGQPIQMGEDQQVVYLPKDTYLIVQGEDGSQQFIAPMMQQVPVATPQLVVQSLPLATPTFVSPAIASVAPLLAQSVAPSVTPMVATSITAPVTALAPPVTTLAPPVTALTPPVTALAPPVTTPTPVAMLPPQSEPQDLSRRASSVMTEPHGDVRHAKTTADNADQGHDKVKVTEGTEKSAVSDPSVVTAIESLLKLGYKIERPQEEAGVVVESPIEMETPIVNNEAVGVITMPVDAPESAATFTVTTSSGTATSKAGKKKGASNTSSKASNSRCHQDVIRKLQETGHKVHSMSVGSA